MVWSLQRIRQVPWTWLQWTLGSLWWLQHQWLNSSESGLAPVTIHSTIQWTVPAPNRFQTDYYLSHSTNHCAMNSTPEKQEDKTLFMNSDHYCSSNSAPTTSFSLLFTFGWKRNSPVVKAFHLLWFQQSPEESKASSSLYKESSASFFNKSNLVETQESTLEIVSVYKSCNLTFSYSQMGPQFISVTKWPQLAFYFHVSRWPQSALSFLYFCIVCNLPPFWYIYIYIYI